MFDEMSVINKIKYLIKKIKQRLPSQNLSELKKNGAIIRNEINIHTVIKGYIDAFHFV
jgi:DNA-binding HxlR family transcriptional regulator